ncbi:MAG: YfiR family protein [Rhodospirillaceae bacterium]
MRSLNANTVFRQWGIGALIAGFALIAEPEGTFGQASLEYPIKAVFLYKFGDFVSWPRTNAVFSICIVGRDPFGDVIDRVTAGERVGDRAIAVVRLDSYQENQSCDVAYLGGVEDAALPGVLSALSRSSVLSVTDEATNKVERGVIHFAIRQNRVRFYIDQAKATRSGITVRSSLLAIAIEPDFVRPSPE